MVVPDRGRKYAPPTVPESSGQANGGRRSKDDLHEWSIYRQNLTSSIAYNLLSPPAWEEESSPSLPPPPSVPLSQYRAPNQDIYQNHGFLSGEASDPRGVVPSASEDASGGRRNGAELPYGEFHMHEQSVESVLNQGRQEDLLLGDKGDIYLRFGLPRVALPQGGGGYGLFKQGSNFRAASSSNGAHHRRRAQSEVDLRAAVMNEAQPGQSGESGRGLGRQFQDSGPGPSTRFASMEQGLDQLHYSNHYANTEIDVGSRHPFDVADFVRPNGVNGHKDQPQSSKINGFSHHHHHQHQNNGYKNHQSHLNPSQLDADRNSPPIYSGAFLQSKRHHAHYFSNLDLFNSTTNGAYNYLRYAKADELQNPVSKNPHLALRNVGFEKDCRTPFDVLMLRSPKYKRVLDNVSLELFGGETVAIMHSSEEEAGSLLSLMAYEGRLKGRAEGSFLLNALPLRPRALGDRAAYVSSTDLHPGLTVREHMQLTCCFTTPASTAFPRNKMIAQLIQTLALAPFQNRLIGDIGRTEHQRVKVACKILLDTDILLLDNVTKKMDLYDTAFLIDYLRDWAAKLNRIVLMTINPPTYEILTMFQKAAIIASGKVIYFGPSSDVLSYFEDLDYPCPMFKSPCDYYVDLVTHDHLTMEAAVESRERIRRLAELWTQKRPPLSAPGPPGAAPSPRVRHANFFAAIGWNYIRFWYLLINQPWNYAKEFVGVVLMSLLLGTLYFSLSTAKIGGIADRLGLFYTLLTFALLPSLWINIGRVVSERRLVYPDIQNRRYSLIAFLIAKMSFELPMALLLYAFYAAPVYLMSNLQSFDSDKGQTFGIYLGIVILYCTAWRMISYALAYAFSTRKDAALLLGFILLVTSVSAGVTIHSGDIWYPLTWLRYASPTQWAQQFLTFREFFGNSTLIAPGSTRAYSSQLTFKCTPKTIVQNRQGFEIETATRCNHTTGGQIFKFMGFEISDIPVTDIDQLYYIGVPVIAGWGFIAFLCSFCCVFCNHPPRVKRRHRS